MKRKDITSTILVSLLLLSTFLAPQLVVNASAEGSNPVKAKTSLAFTVGPDGQVGIKASHEGPPEDFEENATVEVSVSINENREVSSVFVKFPPEVASEFPMNSSTLSLLLDYANDLVTAKLNATTQLPQETASQSPSNVTDLTLHSVYKNGDLNFQIDSTTEANLTKVLELVFYNIFIGFNQSFSFPVLLQLQYSKGNYEGLIVLHLLPGFPVGDLEASVNGNLTDIRFNGTINVIYGNYFGIEINSTFVDMVKYYAENVFNASIDTSGSLLNMTAGKLSVSHVNIERENITGGEKITFDVRIHGDLASALAEIYKPMLEGVDMGEGLPLPIGMYSNFTYLFLNETLHKIQNTKIQVTYTPTDTMLYVTLNGTIHLQNIVEQITEEIATHPNATTEAKAISQMINSTIYSIRNSTVDLTYSHNGTASLKATFVMNPEEALNSVVSLLDEVSIPPSIKDLVESVWENRLAEIVSAHLQLTYSDGKINCTEEAIYTGDINAQANLMKPFLLELFNETVPEGLDWRMQYLNETLFDVTGVNVRFKVDNTSLTLKFDGLAVKPPLDIVNATVFKLERFFNLTSEDNEFPGENETLSVTVLGGSNSTHKIVLHNGTGVTPPDVVLKDALNRTILMTWNNVSLTSLKQLEFIIVSGAQTGEAIFEPGEVTPTKPVVINATETMKALINITGVSDPVNIVVSNVTKQDVEKPPPGTWKVLGNYMQIVVSNESASVNATIRMYYTDQQVADAGVDESTLKIFRWNGTAWNAIEPSYVNTQENHVWVYVNRLSLFALMGDVPPVAVTASLGDITESSLKLSWTQNQDPDFARYEIFRSTTTNVLGTSIANVTGRTTLSYTATGLASGTKYYFTVRVWDTVGLYRDSVQVSETTALPMWQQPWFIGTVIGVIAVVIVVAVLLMRKKAPAPT